MKKILFHTLSLATILVTLFSARVNAQQDPLFSQYMFNKLAVNPAYAGSRDVLTLDALYRYQWVNIEGAPQTFSASMHSPLRNNHMGLGLNVYHDVIGPSINQGAMATFSYRILFPNSKLSFGIQAGYKYTDVLWSRIVTLETEDPLLRAPLNNKAVPDASFGVYYYSNKYYVGFSSKQLFQNQMGVVSVNGEEQFTKLLRHFYGMAGAAFPISEDVVFRPSALVKFVKNAPPQMDLNASFMIKSAFWLGVSYRTEKALSFMAEFNLSENLRMGYSYDHWFNELQSSNKGSHEVRLSFDFDIFHSRMLTPRYF
ncbi:MAG: type IX secretion system membrane protein PorP/SprF [Bacteroidales bacterium]|nr:type IX secretion system membrane protein PorP/SprF [Bacteroidales bacterium]MBK7175106.1 type IX secretion system membrane protein PorP/SprF [Bacteroidales bacterium]